MGTEGASAEEGKSLQELIAAGAKDTPAEGKDTALADKVETTDSDQQVSGEDQDTDKSSDDDPLTVTKFYDEEFGASDAKHFRDDREWFRHVKELQQKIGERNEDAILGRKLRERLGDEGTDLEALLNATPAKGKKQQGNDLPELKREWFTFDEEGKIRPSLGAPKDLTQRYLQRQIALLTEPEKFFEGLLGPKLKEIEDQAAATREEVAQRQEHQEIDAACDRHRNVLYVGGDRSRGMTALGQQIVDDVVELATSGSQAVALMDRMVKRLVPQQSKPNTHPVSYRAVRQPSIAQPTGPTEKEMEERMAIPGELTKILIERMEREKSAKV